MKSLLNFLFVLLSITLLAQPKVLPPTFDSFGDEITLRVSSENSSVSYFDATIEYYGALNDGCGSDASAPFPDISEIIRLNREGSTDVFSGTGLYFTYQNVHIRIRFQGKDASGNNVSGENPEVFETDLLGLASCGCFDNTINELNTFLSAQTMLIGGGNVFIPSNISGNPQYTQYHYVWTYPSDWELIDYEGPRATFNIGNEPGEVAVRAVNPCTGQESVKVSYFAKVDQTITFNTLASVELDDPDFDLSATATSGLPVSYASSNTSVATVDGSTVSIVGAGSTTITASQSGNGSYNAAPNVMRVLTVNKANQTISFDSFQDIKYSDGGQLLTATASSGLQVTYSSSNPSIANINNGQVFPQGVGTVNITASQSGGADYNPAPDVVRSLTVLKGDQTISFDPINGSFNVNNNSFGISADASSLLDVQFSSSDESVATISGSIVNIEGAGTTTITASQPGNSLYNPAPTVSQEVTVNKLSQDVTVPDLSLNPYTFNQSPGPFQVLNTSGLDEMTFESSDESVFTIKTVSPAGGGFFWVTLEIVGAGSATLTATQPGNETYESASASSEVIVEKDDQLITFFDPSPVFADAPDFQISATAESGEPVTFTSSNPAVATVDGTTVSIVGGGTTNLIASQGGNQNYNPAEDVIRELTVMKVVQSISFNTDLPIFADFGEGPFSIAPTASSGLPVTLEVNDENIITIENGSIILQGVGNGIITATQAGNDIYLPQTNQIDIDIYQATQSITFDLLEDKQFGDADFDLTASSTSGLPIVYTSGNESVATVDGNTVTIVGVGSTLISANQPGNANYQAAGERSRTLTVEKADQTISFSALDPKTFGDPDFTLGATSSSGLSISYLSSNLSVATIEGNTISIVGAGSSVITASQTGNASFTPATEVTQTLNVSKANQTISFPAIASRPIDDDPFNLEAVSTSGLPITYSSADESVATISGSTVTIVGVGTTTITANQAGNANYNPAGSTDQTFTVTLLNQTISFTNISTRTFGDDDFDLTATASSGLPVSFDSSDETIVSINGSTVSIIKPGAVTITASQAGNSSYEAAESVDKTLLIEKVNQNITFEDLSDKVFGDSDFELQATSSSGLSVSYLSSDASIASVSGSTVSIQKAGTVTITARQTGDEFYNTATEVERTFMISKADQMILFEALSEKSFGDEGFDLSASASSGLPITYSSSDESIASISGTTVSLLKVGSVTITASQTGDDSYEAAMEVENSLVINKANQSITFEPLSNKTVGDTNFDLEATASSGLPVTYSTTDTDIITITESTITILAAGTATITASQEGDENYNVAEDVVQELVIQGEETATKSIQEITFSAISSKTYGDPEFDLSATASSGLDVVFSSSDESIVIIEDNKASILAAGTVSITASQAGNDSFEPVQSSQQLIIVKADQAISLDGMPENGLTTDEEFIITATATSGLEVSLEISGPGLQDNNTISASGAGTIVITASQSGNSNYNAAETVIVNIEVSEAVVSSLDNDIQLRVYPNPVSNYLYIEGIKLETRISLFDLNGKLLLHKSYNTQPLDLQLIPGGQYLIKMESPENVISRRIIVERN